MSLARRVAGALAKRRAPEFEYTPLPTAKSIRLLKILPRTDDRLVHCTLTTVDLSTDPSYEALSYTWAIDSDLPDALRIPTGERRTILVDGATLDVFKNLFNALVQLQARGRSGVETYLWIDAVCINQADEVEKSVQVNMMGAIFRRAARVVVWLGQSSLATDLALRKARPFFEDGGLDDDVSSAWRAIASRGGALVALEALSWVLSRGWFARVWTLQEAVLARAGTVYLMGEREVEFARLLECTRFQSMASRARYMDGMFFHMRSRMAGLDFAKRTHEMLEEGKACTLEAAVTEARNRRAGDGRDKVFGVLSLVRDAGGLAADYTKPIQQVYCECATALLESEVTGIFLLSLVGQIREGCSVEYAFPSSFIKLFRPDGGFVQDLPSWVPDLSAPTRPFPLRDISTLKFSAALSVEPEYSLTEDGKVLELKATMLDKVISTGDCRSTRLLQPIWRLWRLLFKLGSKETYAPTGEPIVSALWRTLVAGTTHAKGEDNEDEEGGSVELTDKDFVEWFVIFAEDTYSYSEKKMRELILEERDEDDPANVVDLAAEPDDRRRRTLTDLALNEKESERLDRYKVHAIRQFLATYDTPAYGFRDAIRRRHERLKSMSRVEVEMEQKLWTAKDPVFDDVFEKFYVDRRIFVTEKGYMGTAPWTIQEGDVIMLVAGTYVPYVFRSLEKRKGSWELVGEAYCHGIMFGEALEKEELEFEKIKVS